MGMRTTFRILGLLNLANGLWMLLAPAGWYLHLPAAVPDTGPLNPHFVRDIGAAFVTIGAVLLLAAPSRGVLLAVTLFYLLHAAVHVTDLAGAASAPVTGSSISRASFSPPSCSARSACRAGGRRFVDGAHRRTSARARRFPRPPRLPLRAAHVRHGAGAAHRGGTPPVDLPRLHGLRVRARQSAPGGAASEGARRAQGGGAGRLPVLNRHRLCRRQGERRERSTAP